MTPEITDAELDKWEAYYGQGGKTFAAWRIGILIKALRACRQEAEAKDVINDMTNEQRLASRKPIVHLPHGQLQCMVCENIWPNERAQVLEAQVAALEKQSKAKDAALERISKRPHSGDAAHPGPHGRKYCNCHVGIALKALDNLPSVAKQGETDDADG